eukprot:354866-Chlamydomonas_euryale.AAC.4
MQSPSASCASNCGTPGSAGCAARTLPEASPVAPRFISAPGLDPSTQRHTSGGVARPKPDALTTSSTSPSEGSEPQQLPQRPKQSADACTELAAGLGCSPVVIGAALCEELRALVAEGHLRGGAAGEQQLARLLPMLAQVGGLRQVGCCTTAAGAALGR